jgi:hypothetical protein
MEMTGSDAMGSRTWSIVHVHMVTCRIPLRGYPKNAAIASTTSACCSAVSSG